MNGKTLNTTEQLKKNAEELRSLLLKSSEGVNSSEASEKEQKVSNITASNLSNLGCFEANYFLFSRRKRHNLLISERTPQHRRPVAATHCRAGQTRADKKLHRWLRREGTGQLSG